MIEFNPEFDKIRPFYNNEANDAINRILKEPGFIKTIRYFFPEIPKPVIIEKLQKVESVREFQTEFISKLVRKIISTSTSGIKVNGLEKLDKNKSYLFISNHRDIVLDSAFLNEILHSNGFETTEIAIGSNLLILPWISDLVRLNKTFIVKRNIPPRELYAYSQLLSSYIRYTVTTKKTSVWIAQREGRTKNGDDITQVSLLKMLNISGENSIIDNFKELNIVPVSISYEYEPLDKEKVIEKYNKLHDVNFKKTRLDDLLSMGKGLTSFKGLVNFNFNNPIHADLDNLADIKNKNTLFDKISYMISNKIYEGYQLHPINYVAADILFKTNEYASYYNDKEKTKAESYFNKILDELSGDKEQQKEMLYQIYANPVKNYMNCIKEQTQTNKI